MDIPLCSVCTRHLKGEGLAVDQPWMCALCFGIMDPGFVDEVAASVKKEVDRRPYDSSSFILALNVPVTVTLRESILDLAGGDGYKKGTLASVPFKLRIIDAYIGKIKEATGINPSLHSDLSLTITFTNDEFNASDTEFLMKHFHNDFVSHRKRKRSEVEEQPVEANYTKLRISSIIPKLKESTAKEYKMVSPTQSCTTSLAFEREPLFLASRYCKFSRCLPQSPWTASDDIPKIPGNSVSEKVSDVLMKESDCESTRFMASGREDIDVRMLGTGRPFVIQLLNPHRTQSFRGQAMEANLLKLETAINQNKEVRLGSPLRRITPKQADAIKVDQENKRKCYTAYCYSTQKLEDSAFEKLSSLVPVELVQKTPIRVLKRRSLLERKRNIFMMEAMKLDDFHFLIRLETQAGTYVKEFVHGDFGRTQPSLADLLGVASGEVDIIQLDVEKVDMEWPPESGFFR